MSKRKRSIEKAAKANSVERKRKQAKKAYYASPAAAQKWQDKKARKQQKHANKE